MTNEPDKRVDIGRLEDVLDIYGSSPARWPEAERSDLLRLAEDNPEAGALLADNRRFDAVLAFAPAGEANADLRNRILAAAVDEGAREARVVPIEAAQGRRAARAMPQIIRIPWQAAVLAASFLVGIYVGTIETVPTMVADSLRIANLTEASDDSEDLFSFGLELAGEGEGVL